MICIVQPGVRARHDLGAGRRDRLGLAAAELRRHLGFEHLVEAGGAAAHVPVRHVEHLDALDRAEQGARLVAEVLHAERVARVVVRDARESGSAPRRPCEPLIVQELHHVAHLRRERASLVGRDQVAELLQVCAASRRVRHHDVDTGERTEVPLGERSRGVEAPVVRGERATTCLGTRHLHPPPVPGQDTDRGAVHLAEPSILHAAAQQRDGSPTLTGRLRHAGEAAEQLGSFRSEGPDPFREREARDRLYRRGEPQQLLPRERDVEPEPTQEPGPSRPERLHLDARALDHPAERHVRGTDVLARPARETQVHEARERLVGLRESLGHRTHRRDPAAR